MAAGYRDELFPHVVGDNSLNNAENVYRKDGVLLTERAQAIRIEGGRDPLDGTYYVRLWRQSDGLELKAVMTPPQFFNMCAGGLVAMARWGFPQATAIVKHWVAPR